MVEFKWLVACSIPTQIVVISPQEEKHPTMTFPSRFLDVKARVSTNLPAISVEKFDKRADVFKEISSGPLG
jgi:hypothetical protein